MGPLQIVRELRRLAARIESDPSPDRRAVSRALARVADDMGNATIKAAIWDAAVDGWSDALEADPSDVIGSLQQRYDVPLGTVIREADPSEDPELLEDMPIQASKLLVIKEDERGIMVAVAVE